jgi:thiosulfate/3-mercaptopyruvate sulfurtransferase
VPVIDAEAAAGLARSGRLLDARAAERYRGEVEPIDPVAGHIPGAISAPSAATVDAEGRFRSPQDLRAHFERLGVSTNVEVGAYCGSGVTAAHELIALELAGFGDAALYAGSWSDWVSDPARPVARAGTMPS